MHASLRTAAVSLRARHTQCSAGEPAARSLSESSVHTQRGGCLCACSGQQCGEPADRVGVWEMTFVSDYAVPMNSLPQCQRGLSAADPGAAEGREGLDSWRVCRCRSPALGGGAGE